MKSIVTGSLSVIEKASHPEAAMQSRARLRPHDAATTSESNFPASVPAAGNQALQRLLRTGAVRAKLTVSQTGDPEEQEADRIADQVMAGPAVVHRQCDACAAGGTCPKCEENERIQAKLKPGAGPQGAFPSAGLKAFQGSGGGEPLSAAVRGFFEPRFGTDFSGVRVHTGEQAANSARSIQARAYTASQDLVFGAGEYAPENDEGRRLLAHELAHVAQQGEVGTATQRQPVAGAATAPAASVQPPQASVQSGATTANAPAAVATSARPGLSPPIYWGRYAPRNSPAG